MSTTNELASTVVARPTGRDPVETRRRILRAATRLFADKGPDAASIDDISRASGYNRRMIYHYFGNKHGLYLAVLENVYSKIRQIVVEEATNSPTLESLIETLMENYFAFLQSNPEFVAMLQWENARGAGGLAEIQLGDFRETLLAPIRRVLGNKKRFARDQEEAAFHVVLTAISMCGYYFSNQHSISVVFQRDLNDVDQQRRWLDTAKQIIVRGIATSLRA